MIDQILNKVLRSGPGVKYVILLDRTGITISNASKFRTDKNTNIDRLGAIGGAVFQAVEEQGGCMDYGKISNQITEYEQGYIFSVSAGEGILMVITDKNINIGLIRNSAMKYRNVLDKILARYLNQDTDIIAQELKSLINPEHMEFY